MTSSQPVRVLIVAPAPVGSDRIGGIVNFISGFVRVAPADFEIEIAGVAVGDEAPADGWQPLSLAGRRVRFLPTLRMAATRRTGRVPLKARIVASMLRRRRQIPTEGRVIQVHAPAMDLAFLGRRAPVIRVVHNAPEDLAAKGAGSAWRRLGRLVEWSEDLSFRRSDSVFFVSRSTYERYAAKRGFAGRVHFLPNFFDESLFRPITPTERLAARDAIATAIGVSPDVPWLLFAGRLDDQKDPALAIRTMAVLRAGTSAAASAVLLVAGEGRLLERTRRQATELGISSAVQFLGNVPQARLAALMQAADAFLLTSAFESGPTVAYEALAAGLPVVSTPVGEVARIVTHRATGYVTDMFLADDLGEGVTWALGQDRDELAAVCSAAVERFSTRAVLEPFIAEHRRVALSG